MPLASPFLEVGTVVSRWQAAGHTLVIVPVPQMGKQKLRGLEDFLYRMWAARGSAPVPALCPLYGLRWDPHP